MKKSIRKVLFLTLIFWLFAPVLAPFSALAAKAGTGTLVITTQDTSKKQVAAPISVDNVQKGTGKVTVNVTAGTHEVKFGDLTWYTIVSPRSGKKSVQVRAGKTTPVTATYKKSSSGGGTTGGVVTGPQITDIDGNVYNSVVIGTQTWIKENLKVTKYRDGTAIPTTTVDISAETSSAYQWAYNGDESNAATYGRLYTWFAATDSRGLCPAGWHLPTDAEWTTLTDYLGGESVVGGKMKEAGTTHWASPNTSADNSSGFTALPGGYRSLTGPFDTIGYTGRWWSATEYTATNAWLRRLSSDYGYVNRYDLGKSNGFSVRCVKD
ncbi:MAG: fibrobacter succinogenes major paralogous domain-containing protein [Nitrospinae bacterium]|nr:fibrobacter succinogenes major paralogous domain-containing protein [Nitrospinota bacterium]